MRAATMTSTLCDSTFRRLTEAWTLDTSRGYAHRTTAAARWWVDLNSLSNHAQDMRESGCRPSVSSDGGHHSGKTQPCVKVCRRKSCIRRRVNAAALCAGTTTSQNGEVAGASASGPDVDRGGSDRRRWSPNSVVREAPTSRWRPESGVNRRAEVPASVGDV